MQTTLTRRPAEERGHARLPWLESWHTFSFADYHDPAHHSFRALRVINEDFVAPGKGFPEHPHRDMEIITYVISGELSHRDSMGHTRTLGPGRVQYMSAGSGVTHSEFNASPTEPVHLLQIWIMPQAHGLRPAYAEWEIPAETAEPLTLIGSAEGPKGALILRQDVSLYLGSLRAGESARHRTTPDRGLWFQIISGEMTVNEERLRPGDGLAAEGASECEMAARSAARFLLFDLA